MPPSRAQSQPHAPPAQPTATHAPWPALRAHLEALRREVVRQIAHYPPPITACDAQFNHLLEQRDGLADWLRRLEAHGAAPLEDAAAGRALDDFLAACPYIDADDARRLRGGRDG